ncbi:MAG: HAD family phosphatase [Spirochaetaceae bacterium]|jgi:putative hydrolase of the HAD superfamily|nr:HAD family phosphatase [Spirochaetaceae bacterium]
MAIKAVAFDYGNVISLSPVPGTMEKLAALTGLAVETIQDFDRKNRANLLDRGACDTRGYYYRLFSFAGAVPLEGNMDAIAKTDIDAWKRLNNDTVELMRIVKGLGCKTAILSNMPGEFLNWAREAVPVFREVDAGIFSCELGAVKPEEAIYRSLRDALGCGYEVLVFFDDMADNIAKARALGIHGFIFREPEAAREELRALDPLFASL